MFDIHSLQNSRSIAGNVNVSTATVIIVDPKDPYSVLIADSAKHPRPVLPGGKIEITDGDNVGTQAAYWCALREGGEEIGAELLHVKYIGKASDFTRDVRLVTASSLMGVRCSPLLSANLPSHTLVRAHYGCPDFIFVAKALSVRPTEELVNPRFIDVRTVPPSSLSAGHDVILMWYRRMVDRQEHSLPTEALKDFSFDRASLSTAHEQ